MMQSQSREHTHSDAPIDTLFFVMATVLVISTHKSSEALTLTEILIGTTPVLLTVWVSVRLLMQRGVPDEFWIARGTFISLISLFWFAITIIPAVVTGVAVLEWFRRFITAATFPLMILITVAVFDSEKRIQYGAAFLIIIGIVGVVTSFASAGTSLLEFTTAPQRYRSYGGGYFGPMSITLSIGLLLQRYNRRFTLIAISGLLIGIAGTLISYTRTYWVATTAAVTVVFWLNKQHVLEEEKTLSRWFITALLVSSVATLLFVAVTDSWLVLIERIGSIVTAFDDPSFLDRIVELEGLLVTAFGNPLRLFVGHGFGAEFSFISVNKFSWGKSGHVSISYSHNYFSYLLWTTGIIGITLFSILIFDVLVAGISVLANLDTTLNGAVLGLVGLEVSVIISLQLAPMLTKFKWGTILGVAFGLLLSASHMNIAGEEING